MLTDNLPCPINKTIKTIGLKQDIYHREGRGGEDFGGGHMVLGGKGGGSVIANRVLGGGGYIKFTANELLMGEGRWTN